MKTSLLFGTALAALLVTGVSSAAVTKYAVTLDGAQEVPAVTTTATGSGTLDFDDQAKTLKGTITYTGLSGAPNAAHIHKGACGESGGVAKPLENPGADSTTVNVTLTDAQITDLVAGNLYVNFHTAANGGGEIRGQLYPEGSSNKCPPEGPDAGSSSGDIDSGTSSSGGNTSSSSGSSGNDASTVRPDGGTSSGSSAQPSDDGGCSTTGSSPVSGLAIAFGVGVAIAAIGKRRRTR